ncbi:MAG: peptidoglycan D,D-transpeptidase FtsI family protein [Actinomycetota bacterium]
MQGQIRKVAFALLVAFIAVFFQLNYVQIFAAERIAGNDANIRSLLAEYAIKRGDILTSDLESIATSRRTGGRLKFRRRYPQGDLYAHITGFYSVVFGEARIERSFNDQLLGESGVITMQDIEDRFLGAGRQGDNVRLTIDSAVQQAARDSLGGQQGAVVALDPSTGEVRAMWSNPSYDPNPLAAHNTQVVRSHWDSLDPASPQSPLVSKTTSRGYPPGSTFKVVTAAAALESGDFTPQSTFEDVSELDLPLTDETVQNFGGGTCIGGGQITFAEALRVSCNTTFARLGLRVHNEITDMADALGFNEPLPFDVGTEAALVPRIPDDEEPFRAFQGIGQGSVVATPLQMAVIAATVGNGGIVPRPRLVAEVIDEPSGGIVRRYSPESLGRAMSRNTASQLTGLMTAVVETGTGTAAQIPGLQIAGKTGTAQTVEGQAPHAWFIAFAPANNPRIAVAVIVENGGTLGSEATGGAVAAPIARAVIEADRTARQW